jgi:hypothetical protein
MDSSRTQLVAREVTEGIVDGPTLVRAVPATRITGVVWELEARRPAYLRQYTEPSTYVVGRTAYFDAQLTAHHLKKQ